VRIGVTAVWHSHRHTCSTARAGRFTRENKPCRRPANILPAVREAPAFTPGRMSHKEILLDIITEISDKFDENDLDELHFVYANWDENDATDIKPSDREFISQAFSCNPKSHDLCQEPTIYIKSSTDVDGWENSFRYIVSYEIANQYLI